MNRRAFGDGWSVAPRRGLCGNREGYGKIRAGFESRS
jgi:hypothetical protein